MTTPSELEVLRRPYTRSIPHTLRSIDQLQASLEDVKQQWWALLRESSDTTASLITSHVMSASDVKTALSTPAKQSLGTLTRLTGQLKAIKQELIAHLSRVQSLATAVDAAASPSEMEAAGCAAVFFAHLLPLPAAAAAASETAHQQQSAERLVALARRVWVWTLLFAVISSDMELLSGTVSYAVRELFPDVCADDEASEWPLFFGNASSSSSPSSPLGVTDAVFIHGCAVVYEAFVSETSPVESCAHEWTRLQPWMTLTASGDAGLRHSDDEEEDVRLAFILGATRIAGAVVQQDMVAVKDAVANSESKLQTTPLATVLHLLVRLLSEMLVRPWWAARNAQNAFRPIPAMEPQATPPLLDPRLTTSVVWCGLSHRVADLFGAASAGGQHRVAREVSTKAFLCHIWQLCSLERFCAPWPVPEDMLRACVGA